MFQWKEKALAAALCLLMAVGLVPAAASGAEPAAQTQGGRGKILSLSFDDAENGFHGSGGKAVGVAAPTLSEDAVRGKALQLDGTNSNYLKLTREDGSSLMNGCEEFTVSYWSKVSERVDPNWSLWMSREDSPA